MFRKLLIATDGSDLATKAVTQGVALAKETGAGVVIATVSEPWSAMEMAEQARLSMNNPIDAYQRETDAFASRILSKAKAVADDAEVQAEAVHVKERRPAQGILEAAAEHGCDLIVMATHGRRGLTRILLGSQTNEVLHYSTVPVLVVR